MKGRSQLSRKLGFAASKTVSNAKRFRTISEEKMNDLKKEHIKRRTYVKMKWVVKAFCDWRQNRMSDITSFDVQIYETDIDTVDLLERDTFVHCRSKKNRRH